MKAFVLKLSVVFTLLTPIFSEASAVRAADGVDTDAADSLRRFVGNIGAFNRLFPQEKVYLHFDNTAYFRARRSGSVPTWCARTSNGSQT